jgi:hypothetical protein
MFINARQHETRILPALAPHLLMSAQSSSGQPSVVDVSDTTTTTTTSSSSQPLPEVQSGTSLRKRDWDEMQSTCTSSSSAATTSSSTHAPAVEHIDYTQATPAAAAPPLIALLIPPNMLSAALLNASQAGYQLLVPRDQSGSCQQ